MGIRIALGAPPGRVRTGVLRWGLSVAGAGTSIGLLIALALDDLIQMLLYGVSPGDPLTVLGVTMVMLCVTVAACALPARRATRVDPLEVLRSE